MSFKVSGTAGLTFPDTTVQDTAAKTVIPSGAITNFANATAPVGWTQITTYNDYAMRIVSGTGAGTGGSVGFSSAFVSQAVNGSVGNTTLSLSQSPVHNHQGAASATYGNGTDPHPSDWMPSFTYAGAGLYSNGNYVGTTTVTGPSIANLNFNVVANGGGSAHGHSFSCPNINLAVQYLDNILCVKN